MIRQLCIFLVSLMLGLFMTGCMSPEEVESLNKQFMSPDSRLVQTTVDKMLSSGDPRFAEMAADYLQNSKEARQTHPAPHSPAEIRVDSAIRILVKCDPKRAREMLKKVFSAEPSPSFRLPPWSLRLAAAMNSPEIWRRLCELYRDRQIRSYERFDIGKTLRNAGVEQFARDVRELTRKKDNTSVGFFIGIATAEDIDLLLWCLENIPNQQDRLFAAIGKTKTKQGLATLLALANREDWRDTNAAQALIMALAEYSDADSAAVLHKFAKNKRKKIRLAAQRALVARGDKDYIEALYRRLTESKNWGAANVVIKTLKEDGTPGCLDILRRHVRERSTDTWPLSALVLTEMGDADAKAALSDCLINHPEIAKPLFRISYFKRLASPTGFDLLLVMASRDWPQRHILIEEVRRVLAQNANDDLSEPIHAGLRHESPLVREACVSWVFAIKKADAIKWLRPMLNDPSPNVRRRVLGTLSAAPNAAIKTEFQSLLKDSPDPEVRRIAASAFGKWGDSDYIPDLKAAMKDNDAHVRARAMTALAKVDGEQAGRYVIAMLDDPSLYVRNEAIQCATNLKLAAAVDKIRPFLNHSKPQLRCSAIRFFRAVPDKQSIPLIAARLKKGYPLAERQSAIRTLTKLKATSAAKSVLEALAGEPDDLTTEVLRHFMICPDACCVPRLLEMLAEPKYSRWHRKVIWTLGCQKDNRAVETLGDILNTPGRSAGNFKSDAGMALAKIATPEAQAVLKEASESKDPYVRRAAGQAIRSAKQKK